MFNERQRRQRTGERLARRLLQQAKEPTMTPGKEDITIADIYRGLAADPVVQRWFFNSISDIGQTMLTYAQANGLDSTLREVRRLYLAWVQQPTLEETPPVTQEPTSNIKQKLD